MRIYTAIWVVTAMLMVQQAAAQSFAWVETAGSATENDVSMEVRADGGNNAVVCGWFFGSTTFGSGGSTTSLSSTGSADMFLAKYNTSGNLQWAVKAGGSGFDGANAIAIGEDDCVYVTGGFSGSATFGTGGSAVTLTATGQADIFIAKYDSTGSLSWARQAGGTLTEYGIAVEESDSGFVVVGDFQDTVTFATSSGTTTVGSTSSSTFDGFIGMFDGLGHCIWVKSFGSTDNDFTNAALVDDNNNVYVGGAYRGMSTWGAGGGAVTLTSRGKQDAFMAKYDHQGNFVWVKDGGGKDEDQLNDAYFQTHDDRIHMAIRVSDTATWNDGAGNDFDVEPLVLDKRPLNIPIQLSGVHDVGSSISLTDLSVAGYANTTGVYADVDSNIYHVGAFEHHVRFGSGTDSIGLDSDKGSSDIYIVKFDKDGEAVWANSAGGSGYDIAQSVVMLSNGTAYLCGQFSDTATFGAISVVSVGQQDIFLARIDNCVAPLISSAEEQLISTHSVSIYPNPTSGHLSIGLSNFPVEARMRYRISDVSGTAAMNGTLPVNTQVAELDVSTLTRGVYVLRIIGSQASSASMFIKQ